MVMGHLYRSLPSLCRYVAACSVTCSPVARLHMAPYRLCASCLEIGLLVRNSKKNRVALFEMQHPLKTYRWARMRNH